MYSLNSNCSYYYVNFLVIHPTKQFIVKAPTPDTRSHFNFACANGFLQVSFFFFFFYLTRLKMASAWFLKKFANGSLRKTRSFRKVSIHGPINHIFRKTRRAEVFSKSQVSSGVWNFGSCSLYQLKFYQIDDWQVSQTVALSNIAVITLLNLSKRITELWVCTSN